MPVSLASAAQLTSRVPMFLLSSVILVFSSGCSVFGVESVEEAPYELIRKDKQFEIRKYAPLVVVETRVSASYKEAGSMAFRKLFAYISGENEGSEKIAMTSPVIANEENSGESIAMTAPVTSQKEGDEWRYRFVLPQSYSLDNAPRPLNPDVSLAEVPEKQVASLRYSGRSTRKAQVKQAETLGNWIASQGLVMQSEPRWAGYNPPWTLPWFRRNEVLIDISSQ